MYIYIRIHIYKYTWMYINICSYKQIHICALSTRGRNLGPVSEWGTSHINVTYEWVTSQMDESVHMKRHVSTHEWGTSRVNETFMYERRLIWVRHVSFEWDTPLHLNEARLVRTRHIWIRHVTYEWDIYEWGTSLNEVRHLYEAPHINESPYIWRETSQHRDDSRHLVWMMTHLWFKKKKCMRHVWSK